MNTNDKKGVLSMSTTVHKWGNSLGVRIPQKIAREFDVVNGSRVEFKVIDNEIRIKPIKEEPTLEELLSQVTDENRHEFIDWGKPEGNEVW